MTQLVFNIPDRDAPGFLRRQRRYADLQRLMARGQSMEEEGGNAEDMAALAVEIVDQTVDFLLDYVAEPSRDEAEDILLDMSENEFQRVFEDFGKNAMRRTPTSKRPSGATEARRPAPARGRSRS